VVAAKMLKEDEIKKYKTRKNLIFSLKIFQSKKRHGD
jgi:hypothetical protein